MLGHTCVFTRSDMEVSIKLRSVSKRDKVSALRLYPVDTLRLYVYLKVSRAEVNLKELV